MNDSVIHDHYDVRVQDQSFSGVWNENPLLKVLKLPRGIFLILWNCWQFHPDIVHIHTPYRYGFLKDGIMALLAKMLGKKVVMTFHPGNSLVNEYHEMPGWHKRFTRHVLSKCDALIALGRSYAEFLAGLCTHPFVAVIPNPVDDEQVANARTDYSQRANIIFFAGLFVERKGVFDLLKAIDRIQLSDVKFIIQGTAPSLRERLAFQRAYEACRSKDKIELIEWGPVFGQIARSRVVVLPSHGESLPIIMEEAIACGVPVITTPVGVLPDYIQNDVQGLLVTPGDIDGLARAIEFLLVNEAWALQVAQTNQEFGKIFLRSSVHAALMQVYDHLLAQEHGKEI